MSAFLGPIHHWLYNKIQKQLDIVEQIIVIAKEEWGISLEAQLQEYYGLAERRPLEEVIDGGNIHGWLQQQVSGAEYRLAFCVTEIIKEDEDRLELLKDIFKTKGKEMASAVESELNTNEIYKVITDNWLDGMPCDHAYIIVDQGETSITFRRNVCVHESYWKAVQGEVAYYYELRNSWVEGFLEVQGATIEKINEVTYKIEKEIGHE